MPCSHLPPPSTTHYSLCPSSAHTSVLSSSSTLFLPHLSLLLSSPDLERGQSGEVGCWLMQVEEGVSPPASGTPMRAHGGRSPRLGCPRAQGPPCRAVNGSGGLLSWWGHAAGGHGSPPALPRLRAADLAAPSCRVAVGRGEAPASSGTSRLRAAADHLSTVTFEAATDLRRPAEAGAWSFELLACGACSGAALLGC